MPVTQSDGFYRDYQNDYILNPTKVVANSPDCQFNFVVSRPYLSSQNGSLIAVNGASLHDFKKLDGTSIAQAATGGQASYSLSKNATELVNAFITKNKALVNSQGKITNKNIWVNTVPVSQTLPTTLLFESDVTITSDQLLTLSPMTMIVSK